MSFPVLWLYGPPGVGKSTVGWALFSRLTAQGVATAYVDIDQLGMCYGPPTATEWAPEPADDPARYRLKERNLAAVIANYHRAGARGLVVSGIVDPLRGVDPSRFPDAALTPVRLRCEPAELRRRIACRGRVADKVDEILQYADVMEGHGPSIDTTGCNVAAVVDRMPPWLSPAGQAIWASPVNESPGRILWVCGPKAVGKSTVGFAVYQEANRRGVHTAFVDLDQIGFQRPSADSANHRLKAANLAATWPNFRAAGAEQLVVVGPVGEAAEVALYKAALPAATITVCRLHASRATLAERVRLRGQGLGPPIAGDDLVGQPDTVLRKATDAAASEPAAVGDLQVDTDGRAVEDLAAEILSRR